MENYQNKSPESLVKFFATRRDFLIYLGFRFINSWERTDDDYHAEEVTVEELEQIHNVNIYEKQDYEINKTGDVVTWSENNSTSGVFSRGDDYPEYGSPNLISEQFEERSA